MIERTRRWLRGWVACLLLAPPGLLYAQVLYPEDGFVFSDAEVPRMDVTIAQADLESMYENPWSNTEYRAQFSFTREGVSESFADIGIRARGNTSRSKQKKSFRISFNTFVKGGEFHGMEEMNVNGEVNDPSMVRSKLSWTLFRKLGVPSVRSNHVLLYINSEFYGVYINTEHIDENFIRARFETNDGNLYKCTYPADLAYKGPDPDDYKSGEPGERAYDLKTNMEWDDYGDLAEFISTIDQYSGSSFREEIEKVMNVQQYLKIMAVDVISANWDGYIGNKNNFYLYRDQATGRIEYIPYDLDNTWGLDWLGVDWAYQSIYDWAREERPLYDKVMEQEVYREQFTGYVKKLATFITSDELVQEVMRWRNQISSWVSQDTYYPLDFGYQYTDFLNALHTGIPDKGWLPYGVLEYASLRAASALQECIQVDAPPLISYAVVNPSPGQLRFHWKVEDDAAGFTTTLHYRVDTGQWNTLTQQGPAFTDPVSGIRTYRDSIFDLPEEALVEVYYTATDNGKQQTQYPAEPISVSFPLANGPLLINEFMASNNQAVADEFGEYDDWAEIYNPSDSRVWLGSLFLSDKMGSPGKYKFPDKYLEQGEFYLVWLDGQPEQGDNHASFKISKEGEKLRLSGRPAEGYYIMDSLTFGAQLSDVSWGRSVDGGSEWLAFTHATPGYTNLPAGMKEYLADVRGLVLYPNPVTGGILHFSRGTSGTVFNGSGSPVLQVSAADRADVRLLAPGIYIFRPLEGDPQRFVVSGN